MIRVDRARSLLEPVPEGRQHARADVRRRLHHAELLLAQVRGDRRLRRRSHGDRQSAEEELRSERRVPPSSTSGTACPQGAFDNVVWDFGFPFDECFSDDELRSILDGVRDRLSATGSCPGTRPSTDAPRSRSFGTRRSSRARSKIVLGERFGNVKVFETTLADAGQPLLLGLRRGAALRSRLVLVTDDARRR